MAKIAHPARMPRRSHIALALTLSACSGSTAEPTTLEPTTVSHEVDDPSAPGLTINTVTSAEPASSTTGLDSTAAVTTEASESGTESSGVFTSSSQPDFDTGALGCGGKLDLLFILDRDKSMADQQAALAVSLPNFPETIESEFEAFDLHVMVVTPDPVVWGIDGCEQQCALNGGQGCEPLGPPDYPCWAYTENAIDECDTTYGAGQTFPAGFEATNDRCELAGGNRYITSDEPDLGAAFECITHTGTYDTSGAAAGFAMQHALSSEFLGPGGCNEGFVRDDALLVITMITDVNGVFNPGEVDDWASSAFSAKGGDPEAIVMLGVVPDSYYGDAPVCSGPGGGGFVPPHDELLAMFPNMVRASVCEEDFSSFFDDAAALVLDVCESFVPQ